MRDAAQADIVYDSDDLMTQVQGCVDALALKVPEQDCPPVGPDGSDRLSVPFDMTGIAAHYPRVRPGFETLGIILDWEPNILEAKATVGSYDPDRHELTFYLSKHDPKNIPARNGLVNLLGHLKSFVAHELRHAVQYGLLGDHPKQIKRKAQYDTEVGDYFTSPIEFDPQIGTSIEDFMKHYWLTKPTDLANAIRLYVGMPYVRDLKVAPKPFSGLVLNRHPNLRPSPFFHYLKAQSPERYKIAIRKFITGIKAQIKESTLVS